MIQENEEYITFYPGNTNGSVARLFIHDRFRIEAILSRYFNHSSFASLRRQLNYFNFSRIGRGRQRGATYVNETVFDLDDILRLKRREAADSSPAMSTLSTKKEAVLNEKQEGYSSNETKISLDLTVEEPSDASFSYQGCYVNRPSDDLFACNLLLAMSYKARLQTF